MRMQKGNNLLTGLAAVAFCLTVIPVEAAVLVALDGMPFSDVYDAFLVADTPSGLTHPKLAVAPRKLAFDVDSSTSRVRFGFQYDYEKGSPPLAQITATLKFHVDAAEVSQLLDAARQMTGIGDLQIASSGVFSATLLFLAPKHDGSSLRVQISNQVQTDSTIVASIDLSSLERDSIIELLSADSSVGGFVGTVDSSGPIYDRKNDFADWQAIVSSVTDGHIVTFRGLIFPANAKAKSRPDIRFAIIEALGLPTFISTTAGYVLGWDTDLQSNADNLARLLASAKAAGTLTKIALRYVGDVTLPVNSICNGFKNQIVDLETGSQGCDGLKKASVR
jgi:hypothetical protein